ncbi:MULTISPECIES: DNA primase [Streptomyces]|uniref:DNA primase n=1 Tax=Streptomyces TaxID=1883 RepID=UPI000D528687|nr:MULTISPECIES: DNA primase [Streptomyces]AWE53241.1 DNA primase [Streptomyces nigra]MCF2537426.1 DNA primase [Streptomyces sp. FB2]
MNRVGLGLAIGAGYVLGRTKKAKMALAVGSLVAGKKLNLTPKALAELVTTQLAGNPQFKELGDQLRQDLSGVGKAASGALVERQIAALADRLHGRTAEVREQLAGGGSDDDRDEDAYDDEDEAPEDEEPRADDDEAEHDDEAGDDGEREERAPARKAAKKAPAKKAAKKAPAKKAAAKKTAPAKKTAAKKTGSARSAARRTSGGARRSEGGDAA